MRQAVITPQGPLQYGKMKQAVRIIHATGIFKTVPLALHLHMDSHIRHDLFDQAKVFYRTQQKTHLFQQHCAFRIPAPLCDLRRHAAPFQHKLLSQDGIHAFMAQHIAIQPADLL